MPFALHRPSSFLCVVLLAAAACGGGGKSDSPGTVSGTVRDLDTGLPLAGVWIGDGANGATTGADGTYALSLSPGQPTLGATLAGYVQTWRVAGVASGATTPLDWRLTASPGVYADYTDPAYAGPRIPADAMTHVILAWNDLGMHCAQDDYSYFLILPPFNTLHAQVIERGGGLVKSGITVSYRFPNKTDSTLHTNYWSELPKYDLAGYGWDVTPNHGVLGTPLAGEMTLEPSGLEYVARGIPITPYDDDGTWDPYGTAEITVTDSASGAVLATATVVAPVSTELQCANCHGAADPFLNILQVHDKNSATHLVADRTAGRLHLCAECHADNALGLSGATGVKNLSRAMHGFHKDKVNVAADPRFPDCYNCHPGPATQCLRGNMFHAEMGCRDCHGDMRAMAAELDRGREPWLSEPRCGGCHGSQYAENDGKLYRDSVLVNSPEMDGPSAMNGKVFCEACHNSTHAEHRSTLPADASIPQQLQGDDYWIWNCWSCHTDYMPSPTMHLPL
jgi:hypothetical protein